MVNGRVTLEQWAWLQEKADELDGNLSAALRQALTDAQLLEMARRDYRTFHEVHPDFEVPLHEHGPSWTFDVILGLRMTDNEDLELRAEEEAENAD
jgi:hypothetical protein